MRVVTSHSFHRQLSLTLTKSYQLSSTLSWFKLLRELTRVFSPLTSNIQSSKSSLSSTLTQLLIVLIYWQGHMRVQKPLMLCYIDLACRLSYTFFDQHFLSVNYCQGEQCCAANYEQSCQPCCSKLLQFNNAVTTC